MSRNRRFKILEALEDVFQVVRVSEFWLEDRFAFVQLMSAVAPACTEGWSSMLGVSPKWNPLVDIRVQMLYWPRGTGAYSNDYMDKVM
jgi:hypothetical protein